MNIYSRGMYLELCRERYIDDLNEMIAAMYRIRAGLFHLNNDLLFFMVKLFILTNGIVRQMLITCRQAGRAICKKRVVAHFGNSDILQCSLTFLSTSVLRYHAEMQHSHSYMYNILASYGTK